MKIPNHITLWEHITAAINDLEYDEPKHLESDKDAVFRLIELAYHYRLECRRLEEKIDEIEFNNQYHQPTGVEWYHKANTYLK